MIELWESNGFEIALINVDNITQEDLDSIDWKEVKTGDIVLNTKAEVKNEYNTVTLTGLK